MVFANSTSLRGRSNMISLLGGLLNLEKSGYLYIKSYTKCEKGRGGGRLEIVKKGVRSYVNGPLGLPNRHRRRHFPKAIGVLGIL